MNLEIKKYGHPVLREKGKLISLFDDDFRSFTQDMIETMRDARGIGLAAQQVGKALQVCVVEVPEDHDVDSAGQPLNPGIEMPLVIANPEITYLAEDKDVFEEGCLSFPGVHGKITRPVEIKVNYQDAYGETKELKAKGLLARCIQHEVDHLNGILFIDYFSRVKLTSMRGKLRRLKLQGEQQYAHEE